MKLRRVCIRGNYVSRVARRNPLEGFGAVVLGVWGFSAQGNEVVA